MGKSEVKKISFMAFYLSSHTHTRTRTHTNTPRLDPVGFKNGCIQQADVSVLELHWCGTLTILVELGPQLNLAISLLTHSRLIAANERNRSAAHQTYNEPDSRLGVDRSGYLNRTDGFTRRI